MAVVAAVCAGYSTFQSQNEKKLNCFALANVEALAQYQEPSDNSITCFSGSGNTAFLLKCGSCTWGYTGSSNKSTCNK